MSVPKGKRKESQFEVIKHFYRLRKDMTDLLLRDFGYSQKKAEMKMSKMFGGRPYEELSNSQQEHYNKTIRKSNGFEEWFIGYQRDTIVDCVRSALVENYYKIMSKKQRENMNLLFQELKEEYYV